MVKQKNVLLIQSFALKLNRH